MAETRAVPKHKKNPTIGTKETSYSNVIYMEQADAVSFALNEEVSPRLRSASSIPFLTSAFNTHVD